MHHLAPNTNSVQKWRGVLDEESQSNFHGLINIAHGAKKSDGRQEHKAIILSEKAKVNAKPYLEIYEKEVKCSHGASVGKLDENAMFYLRSRGIILPEAKQIMITSFLSEAEL